MNAFQRFFPAVVAVAASVWVACAAVPQSDSADGMHLHEFGKIPVLADGRIKPIDTVARNDLVLISGRQTFHDNWVPVWVDAPKGSDPKEHLPIKWASDPDAADKPAIQWLLDAITDKKATKNTDPHILSATAEGPDIASPPEDLSSYEVYSALGAREHPVFRIENDQVLNLLGLEARPGSYRYSLNEIGLHWKKLAEEVERAKAAATPDLYDEKLLELAEHLRVYIELSGNQTLLAVPPAAAPPPDALPGTGWTTLEGASASNPNAVAFNNLLGAYDRGDAEAFNKGVDDYRATLAAAMPKETAQASFEVWFNDFAPFYQCAVLYVIVFVLTSLAWAVFTGPLNRAAFWLAAVTLVVHTTALIARMYLMNRPFVFITNLYSTAIFIGWIGVIAGLVFEALNKDGIGNFVASVAGFATMVIAHFLSIGGDTLEMMRAVLDTNFWLATHVTAVNTGYAATFVAGLLGTLFVLRGFLTPSLDRPAVKKLSDAIYGAVCFATLFSFVGTVLGGIWADQSWGRFWGWDPKENGALMIVIWNALILHARWGGMVKQRGMAVLTLGGNIITAWSWFGVNLLGIGLHAYGFMSGTAWALGFYAVSQVALIAVGMLPLRLWRSFAHEYVGGRPEPVAPASAPNGKTGRGSAGIVPGPA